MALTASQQEDLVNFTQTKFFKRLLKDPDFDREVSAIDLSALTKLTLEDKLFVDDKAVNNTGNMSDEEGSASTSGNQGTKKDNKKKTFDPNNPTRKPANATECTAWLDVIGYPKSQRPTTGLTKFTGDFYSLRKKAGLLTTKYDPTADAAVSAETST